MLSKIKTLLLTAIFLLVTLLSNAQITTSSIAIQGIARDVNNAVKKDTTISLTITMYYKNGGNQDILVETQNIITDYFGVFSLTVEVPIAEYSNVANFDTYLKIEDGTTLISDELLRHVPYAVAALNGVPTGSIMPFLGTTAPNGWALCYGQDFSTVPGSANLKNVIGGTKVPDLRGMFLRGSGTHGTESANMEANTLKSIQQSANKQHLHAIDLNTSIDGDHNHNNSTHWNQLLAINGLETSASNDASPTEPNIKNSLPMLNNGDHSHNVNGNSGNAGTVESRPINYGVNYIIKL